MYLVPLDNAGNILKNSEDEVIGVSQCNIRQEKLD